MQVVISKNSNMSSDSRGKEQSEIACPNSLCTWFYTCIISFPPHGNSAKYPHVSFTDEIETKKLCHCLEPQVTQLVHINIRI